MKLRGCKAWRLRDWRSKRLGGKEQGGMKAERQGGWEQKGRKAERQGGLNMIV